MCVFKCLSSIATLHNLMSYFIFKVYTAPKRVEQTLHTVAGSADTKMTQVEQVEPGGNLLHSRADIPSQIEETREMCVEQTVASDEDVVIPADFMRKKNLLSTETVTKEQICEIEAKPSVHVMHSETNKKSEASGDVENATRHPDLVLKSDVSQTKPEFSQKAVASEEVVSVKVLPQAHDIKMKKESNMSEIGT